ncbi:MAG: hypothetical protein ACR2IB_03840 [Pyrinomonadaceae bacterium]
MRCSIDISPLRGFSLQLELTVNCSRSLGVVRLLEDTNFVLLDPDIAAAACTHAESHPPAACLKNKHDPRNDTKPHEWML